MLQQPNLDQFDLLRRDLRDKMLLEVSKLEERIRLLNDSNRVNKEILIATYRKVIDRKESFLQKL